MANMWYDQDEKSPSEIAALLHRDKSTLTRFLVKKQKKKAEAVRSHSVTKQWTLWRRRWKRW